jgi:hypothetical protein
LWRARQGVRATSAANTALALLDLDLDLGHVSVSSRGSAVVETLLAQSLA